MTLDGEVLVAGCGPVGAAVACLLAAGGVRVAVVDPADVTPFPRAVAADDAAQRVLADCGVPDTMLHVGGVRVLGRGGRLLAAADLGPSRYARSGLGYFHQPTLERALRARLAALGVEVRRAAVTAVAQDAAGVTVTLSDGGSARAGWLLAADGGRSTVRGLLGVAYAGRTLAPPWVVVDAAVDDPLAVVPSFAYLAEPARPGVLMPRPGGLRLERVLRPGEDPEVVGPRLLRDQVGDGPVVERAVGYAFHARCAVQWRRGRVLLLGDAAHAMPPFAGQGLGAGLRDAAAVAWRLRGVVRGWAAPHALDDAVAERRADVARMTRLSLVLGAAVSARGLAATLRDGALPGAARLPGVGGWLRSGGPRPAPHLVRRSVRSAPGLPADGRALPGTLDRLVPAAAHLLVGRGVDPDAALGPADRAWWDRVGATRVVLGRDADDGGALATVVADGAVAVVRPDHAVAAVVPVASLADATTAYRRWIGGAGG